MIVLILLTDNSLVQKFATFICQVIKTLLQDCSEFMKQEEDPSKFETLLDQVILPVFAIMRIKDGLLLKSQIEDVAQMIIQFVETLNLSLVDTMVNLTNVSQSAPCSMIFCGLCLTDLNLPLKAYL